MTKEFYIECPFKLNPINLLKGFCFELYKSKIKISICFCPNLTLVSPARKNFYSIYLRKYGSRN